MRKLIISNHLDHTSIRNLQRMRGRVDILHDMIIKPKGSSDPKPASEDDIQGILCMINSMRTAKCAGKIIRRVFKKYGLMSANRYRNKIRKLIKKHPDHTEPLHAIMQNKNGMLLVSFSDNGSGMPVIAVDSQITKDDALKIANCFNAMIKKYVPAKYLKYSPYF